MTDTSRQCTAFAGTRLIASGPLPDVAARVKAAADGGDSESILMFDDEDGEVIELDLRGTEADVLARLAAPDAPVSAPRRVGRPKLGVAAREVTLMPRHWDWLAAQPEGASAALRKLVEAALRDNAGRDRARRSWRSADRFLYRMAGDLPLFEDVYRAFYAKDFSRMGELMAAWPADVRTHAGRLVEVAARDLAAEA